MQPGTRISPTADPFSRCLAERTNALWYKQANGDYLSQDICPGGLRLIAETFDTLGIGYTLQPNADGSSRLSLSHAMANQFLTDTGKTNARAVMELRARSNDTTGRAR